MSLSRVGLHALSRWQFLCQYWRHVQRVHGLRGGQVLNCDWRQLVKHLCCVSQQHLLARGQWQHHRVHLQQGLLWARRARMCCLCCRQVQGCQRQRSHSDERLPRLHCRQVFKHVRCKFVKRVCGLSQRKNIECIERRPRRLRAMTRPFAFPMIALAGYQARASSEKTGPCHSALHVDPTLFHLMY